MFTRDEKRALVFLAATAVLGAGVRAVRARADAPPGESLVAAQLPAGDLAAQDSSARRALALARPLEPGERVDVDRADALELDRLPRIGPQLARRIVEERTSGGPFGSPSGLARVPGIGPAILKGLAGRASFDGVPAEDARASPGAQVPAAARDARPRPAAARPAGRAYREPAPAGARGTATTPPPPGRLPEPTVTVVHERRTRASPLGTVGVLCPAPPLDINLASAAELACLPGIGPGLAQRIVTWRTAHGNFTQVNDLAKVPGIGPARVQRVLPYARAP